MLAGWSRGSTEAGIHTDTGQVYATFQSIDPNTELPPDVLTGFLPPEDGTGRGQGYFSYLVRADAGLAHAAPLGAARPAHWYRVPWWIAR